MRDTRMAADFAWDLSCCPPVTSGKVRLSAEIEMRPGVLKPIAWACEQPVNADGSISIEVKPADDPKFRKAV